MKSKVRVFHTSGIPAGEHEVVEQTKTKIVVVVNGQRMSFSRNTKRQLGTPKLTFCYREA